MSAAADGCRADVWLWRARFFKTRPLACRFIEEGRVRLTHEGRETRLDKPSRLLKPGDQLVFALGGRLVAVRYEAAGERRGPPHEARVLYSSLDDGGIAAGVTAPVKSGSLDRPAGART